MGKSIELTKKQREIIRLIPENNVQIIACAGAGKTEVVSRGAAEIIRRGVPPAQIVAFTFTEKAAEELKARIRQVLSEVVPDKADISEMYVGTIHSYCFETLKELFPKYKSYDVLDEAKRVAFLSKPFNYYNTLQLNRLENRGKSNDLHKYTVIERFISSVDIYLNEGVKSGSLDQEIRESIESYFALLEQGKYLDFSTMIHTLVHLTETNVPYRVLLRKNLRNLIVDEYQDINALQERLIRSMIGTDTRICVVGDDDQCIYNWRGSIVDFIIDFKKSIRDATVRRLEDNFRSTDSVIDLAGHFIAKNKKRLSKKMIHVDGEKSKSQKGDIQYFHFDEEREQAQFIINRSGELLGTDFISKNGAKFSLTLGDMAIITRSNDDIARLLPVLDEAKIRYVVDSGRYIFDTEIVKFAMSSIDYVFDLTPPSESVLSNNYKDVFTRAGYPLSYHDSYIRGINGIRREMRGIAKRDQNDYLPELGLQGVYHGILSCSGAGSLDISEADHFYLATL
ncbi:MAG TPA: ATP-dependent helicase, partial [Nitrospirota bacterium]|nr:ATP-dependent helicase [Nitrospirota bacterium]